jgi:hypothetical protein
MNQLSFGADLPGPESSGKDRPDPIELMIEPLGICCAHPLHEHAYGGIRLRPQQQMKMIRH